MSRYAGHTPEPWTWNDTHLCRMSKNTYRTGGGELIGGNGETIVETDTGVYGPFGADRNLIADAPKLLRQRDALLEAAKKCKLYLERYTKLCPEEAALCELCRAAIAACEADERSE